MLPTIIKRCPSAESDFEPLREYQAQTPATFFERQPVLYFHDANVKAWCEKELSSRLHFFSESSTQPSPPESVALEKDVAEKQIEERVEVFVASSKLILFSHASETGIEIPYPSVLLHAIKNFAHHDQPEAAEHKFRGVYMQLEFSGDKQGDDDDDDQGVLELTLIPSRGPEQQEATIDPLDAERTQALFNQISACSNLHPDPRQEGDEDDDEDNDRIVFEGDLPAGAMWGDADGGLPPPMPGSSGWITAENVHEYFDEEGNWIGSGDSGELGEGAGRVRLRDEVEGANGVDGSATNGEKEDNEAKRARTE